MTYPECSTFHHGAIWKYVQRYIPLFPFPFFFLLLFVAKMLDVKEWTLFAPEFKLLEVLPFVINIQGSQLSAQRR